MARYRVLKGVAHNVGYSFVSLMNYAGDDYVMGHILRLGRTTGRDTLTINLMDGTGEPPELLVSPISDVPTWYSKMFWRLVRSHGSDPSLVRSALLVIRYNLSEERRSLTNPQLLHSPFIGDVTIVDARGKEYQSHFDGWWAPEHLPFTNPVNLSEPTRWEKLITYFKNRFGVKQR